MALVATVGQAGLVEGGGLGEPQECLAKLLAAEDDLGASGFVAIDALVSRHR